MAECDECGRDESMPYECDRCGGTFCVEHRLPESHDCDGLRAWSGSDGGGRLGSDTWDDDGNVYDPSSPSGSAGGLAEKLPIDTGPGGIGGYFRNNMTFVFLIGIWITFLLQWIVIGTLGGAAHQRIFVLSPGGITDVWTYFTSMFAHSPAGLLHIGFNSLVLYFFGPALERAIGSKRFTLLYFGAGLAAGVATAAAYATMDFVTAGSLGASGAVLGVMGALAIMNPNMRVMLLIPPIPMSLNTLVGIVVLLSALLVGIGWPFAGGINHLAHLIGVLVGLLYGKKLKKEGVSAPRQIQMGGNRGPGGGAGGRRRF